MGWTLHASGTYEGRLVTHAAPLSETMFPASVEVASTYNEVERVMKLSGVAEGVYYMDHENFHLFPIGSGYN